MLQVKVRAADIVCLVMSHCQCLVTAGRSKGKQPRDKLPWLAVQCLDALLRLGRTAEGVAELLQEVPVLEAADAEPATACTGEDDNCCSAFNVCLSE